MYDWRTWTPEERTEVMDARMDHNAVWHGPTHFRRDRWFHITAACYEHQPWIGFSRERMNRFASELRAVFSEPWGRWRAWCLLPNHYHVLAEILVRGEVEKRLGQLHGRSSHRWNIEEDCAGRKCFHRFLIKDIHNRAHWGSTLNYIHHNPVRHGWVSKQQHWPFSSVHDYHRSMPMASVKAFWDAYPITGMGNGWDE